MAAEPLDIAYLRTWLLCACALVLAVATANLLIDPYGLYRIVEIAGVNSFKSRAAQRGAQFKLHLLRRHAPAAIVLGNSRAEVGFDPRHPALAAAGTAVNLALPGTGIETALEFLQHAVAAGRPRVAIVGLDFVDARVSGDPPRPQGRHAGGRAPGWWQSAADYAGTLLSMDALFDSLRTIRDNRTEESAGLTELGFNPMRDYTAIARAEGYHALFLQRDVENARSYAHGPKAVFVRGSRSSPYFEAVRSLVAECRRHGVELHLVIYPYHAHILELFHATGLWAPFEDWKRRLTEIVQEESPGASAEAPARLWDFSGYTPFAAERVPPAGDRTATMQWYWEAGHFKKELGDVMLDRMLSPLRKEHPADDAFGVQLSAPALEGHLTRIRAGRTAYRDAHAEEALALDGLARAAQGRGRANPKPGSAGAAPG